MQERFIGLRLVLCCANANAKLRAYFFPEAMCRFWLDLKEMFSFPSFIWTFEKNWVKRSKANCLLMEL
jgi:hypothetical protein